MMITSCEAMIDSQLHKISCKTFLECFFAWWGIAYLVLTNTLFWERARCPDIPSVLSPLLLQNIMITCAINGTSSAT